MRQLDLTQLFVRPVSSRVARWAPLLGLAVLPVACGGDDGGGSGGTDPDPVVASVAVSPADPTIQAGETVQLTATPLTAGGDPVNGRAVAWSSGNGTVADVSATGLVEGMAEGSAPIRATVDGVQGESTVRVDPAAVAEVVVDPGSVVLPVGGTRQLSATLWDGEGGELTGRAVSWSSLDNGVATVTSSGLVEAVSEGLTEVLASAEGVADTAQIEVVTPSPVVITGVFPDPMVGGGTATIEGEGFSSVAADNLVTVHGVEAQITAATETELTISVPDACLPAGEAPVVVRTFGSESLPAAHPFSPSGSPLVMAVGEQVILNDPADFCLHFDASGADEAYLVGVQSTSETPSSLTPVRLEGVVPAGATAAPSLPQVQYSALATTSGSAPSEERAQRWRRHRLAEQELREWEVRDLLPLQSGVAPQANLMYAIPPTVAVDDTVSMRVPNIGSGSCDVYTEIDAVVRVVGTRGVWLEDVDNPAGGFDAQDFQVLSDLFDDVIYDVNAAYFGDPTDLDGNNRIAIVVTKEVNDQPVPVLGFVNSGDLLTRGQCAFSDEGEVYYGVAPDPNALYELGQYSVEDARLDAPALIAHEVAHVLQFGGRLGEPFLSLWEAEGQATFAEEVVGHAATGRTIGQDYGFDVAFSQGAADTIPWYEGFYDLLYYYGLESETTQVDGAPEECSFLGDAQAGTAGPCLNAARMRYGVSWSLLRWLSDQYGPAMGGEEQLHRALVDGSLSGFANIEDVVGVPRDTILAQWSATLYMDGRLPGMNTRLELSSWDLLDIENSLIDPAHLVPTEFGFQAFEDDVRVRAGSTAYYRLSGNGRPATAVTAKGTTGVDLPTFMQVWVVRLQ